MVIKLNYFSAFGCRHPIFRKDVSGGPDAAGITMPAVVVTLVTLIVVFLPVSGQAQSYTDVSSSSSLRALGSRGARNRESSSSWNL